MWRWRRATPTSWPNFAAKPARSPLPWMPRTPRKWLDCLKPWTLPSVPPDVVVYNASYRVRGPFETLEAEKVARTLAVTAYGAFLVAQQAVRRMLPNNHGAILFTGASAGVKGYKQSAPFAMGKFALRGLAQSMARELSPQGIHVAHFVIDGGIRSATRTEPANNPDSLLHPDAIAESYWHVLNQPRSAWAWEVELRPWVESF